MSSPFKGGCMCGAIRYDSRVAPDFSIHCYCRQCQHVTGAGHASSFRLALKDVTITGKTATYEMEADSGYKVISSFCPTCGNPIYKKTSRFPDHVYFHAGTLDDPTLFKAQMNVFGSARQPWDHVDPALEPD